MPEEIDLPYYTISAAELAQWFASQSESWWNVDGDPLLTSLVDFPCPSDEIAEAVGQLGMSVRVYDPRKDPAADGSSVEVDRLNDLADTDNNSSARTFLMRWEDGELQWLLAEDLDAANDNA